MALFFSRADATRTRDPQHPILVHYQLCYSPILSRKNSIFLKTKEAYLTNTFTLCSFSFDEPTTWYVPELTGAVRFMMFVLLSEVMEALE